MFFKDIRVVKPCNTFRTAIRKWTRTIYYPELKFTVSGCSALKCVIMPEIEILTSHSGQTTLRKAQDFSWVARAPCKSCSWQPSSAKLHGLGTFSSNLSAKRLRERPRRHLRHKYYKQIEAIVPKSLTV